MTTVDEWLAQQGGGGVVDVDPESRLSIDALQQAIPAAGESDAALGEAARPSHPLPGALDPTPKPMSVDEWLALQERAPEEVVGMAPEGQRFGAQLALGTALSATTGGLGLPARVLLNAGLSSGLEFGMQKAHGEETGKAAGEAALTGALMGGAEAVAPLVGLTVGGGVRGIRGLARASRQGIRRVRGVQPLPEIPRIEKMSAPFAKDFLEEGAEEALEDAVSVGALPPPGQLVEHNLVDTGQGVAEAAIIGGQGIREQRRQSVKRVAAGLDDFVAKLPQMPRQAVADLIDDLATGRLKRIKGIAQGKYRAIHKYAKKQVVKKDVKVGEKQVDTGILDSSGKPITRTEAVLEKQIVEGGVDIRPLKKWYARQLKESGKGKEGGLGNAKIKKIHDRIMEKPDVVTLPQAQRIRSDLYEEADMMNPEKLRVVGQAKRAATRGRALASKAMQDAKKHYPAEIRTMIDEAEALWRDEVRGELTSKALTQILRKQPEDMLDAIIRTGKPSTIRMVRDIVMKENPGVWERVQGSFLARVVHSSVGEIRISKGETLTAADGKRILKTLQGFGKEDRAALDAMFPGESKKILAGFERWASALQLMQKPPGGKGVPAIFFNMGQASAFGLLFASAGAAVTDGGWPAAGAGAAGAATGAVVGFLVPALVVARMFRNPEIVKWLTIGAKNVPYGRPAGKATVAVLGLMLRDGILEGEQAERAIDYINETSEAMKGLGSTK